MWRSGLMRTAAREAASLTAKARPRRQGRTMQMTGPIPGLRIGPVAAADQPRFTGEPCTLWKPMAMSRRK